MGIGTVVEGTVRVGQLEGAIAKGTEAPPDVLEFTLEVVAYRERRHGELKRFRNRVVVRYHFRPHLSERDTSRCARFRVEAGDLLRVQGNYSLHESFDVVSKRLVEHVIVEADMVGVLRAASVMPLADSINSAPTHAKGSK
ncbi:unnamed protein product [Phytomonas sp. EM1]|nr:unnamed protein product [Phytomonas sp. EM1]|eukprot:CCW64168.1 unnamed protein product [Phytomonas sp. isolate EM1]